MEFPSSGFDGFFSFFPVIFIGMFVLVIGVILFAVVRGIMQWNKNNHSPRLTVAAHIVAKRQDVSGGMHTGMNDASTMTDTSYFVTFEVESGDRMELQVAPQNYGQLAEGDFGQLTFQGTRYLNFVRSVES